MIAGWYARKLGLAMKKLGDVGTDHVGKTIATFRIDKPELAIDDWGPLEPMPVLAADVPEVIEKLGIGAFISPQRLVEEGDSVVLNLAKGELRAAWWDDARDELAAGGVPLALVEARACQESEGPIKGLAFVLPATVDSHHVELLVDTGAQHSDVFATSLAGQRLAAQSMVNKEPMYTVSGKISARKLKGARVAAFVLGHHGRRPHRRRAGRGLPARWRAHDGRAPLVRPAPRTFSFYGRCTLPPAEIPLPVK